jgi:tetratricopeptide (TPR) repeat protein
MPSDPLAWHDRTAAHCENFGPPWAALWHLDRLIAARAEDWSLFARRARIHRRLGDLSRAEADESRATALGPPERLRAWRAHEANDLAAAAEAGERWAEAIARLTGLIDTIGPNAGLHVRRADAHARLGHWAAAAADLGSAFQSGFSFSEPLDSFFRLRLLPTGPPSDRNILERLVIYRLTAGVPDGHRSFCTALRRMITPRAAPGVELFVVYLLTIGPDGSTDPDDTVRLAERAIAALAPEEALGAQRLLGAALYRAGRYPEAVPRLETNARPDGREGSPWVWSFLAMAHARLGHTAEVRRCLDHLRDIPSSGIPLPHSLDELEAALLRREAEAVALLDPVFPAEPFVP